MTRFRTGTPLSTGGTAEIYRVFDETLNRPVALKLLRRDDPNWVARLLREARAQARLDHEGICKVYDIGELDGRPYIAMQYLDGEELSEAAQRMSLEEKVQTMIQVAKAVHAAHQEGLIHRDLKPANIMVQRTAHGGLKPVVIDFGLVFEHDHGTMAVTRTGQVMGTPPYMAPEQVEGRENVDRRCDVYALGATLYELLTGRPVFCGDQTVDLLIQILQREPLPPRRHDPSIPGDLETITLKCLAKEPCQRYCSAMALARDLGRFLDGDPIDARPASLAYRWQKQLRKHRLAAGIGLTFALASAAGLMVEHWRADQRLHYEQRFAQIGNDVDWRLRAVYMSPQREITPSKDEIRAEIRDLKDELELVGKLGKAPIHYAIGRCHAALFDDNAARWHLEQAWRLGYRKPEVSFALGLVLTRQYETARQKLQHLRDPELRDFEIERIDDSLRRPAMIHLEKARRAKTGKTMAVEYAEALLALHEGRFEHALDKLKRARKRLTWLYETDLAEGDIWLRQGDRKVRQSQIAEAREDYRRAERSYRTAVEFAGNDRRAHTGLCALGASLMNLELQGSPDTIEKARDRALEACDQAIFVDPEEAAAYIWKALVQVTWAVHQNWTLDDARASRDTLAKALELARKAQRLAPQEATVHEVLGWAHLQLGMVKINLGSGDPRAADLDPAMASLHKALELLPGHPVLLSRLSSTYSVRGVYELRIGLDPRESVAKAYDALLAASEAAPDSFELAYKFGIVHQLRVALEWQAGRDYEQPLLEAEKSFRKALRFHPQMAWAHYKVGFTLADKADFAFRTGEDTQTLIEDAARAIGRAIDINPHVASFYLALTSIRVQAAEIALGAGRDPGKALDDARAHLSDAARNGSGGLDHHAERLRIETVALRWALRQERSLAAVERDGDRALADFLGHDEPAFPDTAVEYLIWRSYACLVKGEDARPFIRRGLELVGQALDRNLEHPSFLGLRGRLFLLRSWSESQSQHDYALAIADLNRATTSNRWLLVELEPWLRDESWPHPPRT